MTEGPDCKFQLTEVPSTTPHCCPLAESLRLLLCCIRMPSIFQASPLPSARARSEPPGSGGNAWGFFFGGRSSARRQKTRREGGASVGGKAKAPCNARPHAAYRDSPSMSKRGASSNGHYYPQNVARKRESLFAKIFKSLLQQNRPHPDSCTAAETSHRPCIAAHLKSASAD